MSTADLNAGKGAADNAASDKKAPTVDRKDLPPGVEPGDDDSPLDSIGKAITAPVEGAAEDEEPSNNPRKPPVPPG